MHDLSEEVLCARWLENPYYQFFCGELSFCHELPFDRSSLTHWRRRLGEAQLADSDGCRPGFRDDLARHSDLMSLAVPR